MRFDRAKVERFIPDQLGKGGCKSAFHTHPSAPVSDTYDTSNVHVWFNRWRKDWRSETIAGAHSDNGVGVDKGLVVHAYARFSTTDPSANATIEVLGHNTTGAGSNRLWDYSTNALLKSTSSPCVPATFLNIKNRVFVAWGGTANFIYNGTLLYDVGVDAPTSAPDYIFDSTVMVTTTAYITNGSAWITEVAPFGGAHKFQAPVASGQTINVDGTNYTIAALATVNFNPGTCTGTAGSNQIVLAGVVLAPNRYNGCYVTTTGGTNTAIPIAQYVTAPNGADTIITLQSNLTNSGAPFTTLLIQGYQVQLNMAASNLTAWSSGVTVQTGSLSWVGVGPRYSYAYYDPVSGHISNVSPLIQITEQDQSNVNIILENIVGTGDTRFTKIKIFRTILSGGTIMVQLTGGAGQPADLNNILSSTISFTDHYVDSILLKAGTLQAPQFTNDKPPAFSHQIYWDGRVWGSPVNDPSAVLFSGDNVQIPFGIPEESYPELNVLRIGAADGRVTGMKLIGNQAVILTERWAYYVAGNNETNYRLLRFSTHMQGVGDYQISEFAGDTTDDSDAVVYIGKDRKVYIMAPSLGNVALSGPVQNFLTSAISTLTKYKATRIHTANIDGRRLIIVRTDNNILIYDWDRKIWTTHTTNIEGVNGIIPDAFTTMYGSDRPVRELFVGLAGGNINLASWLDSQSATTENVASLRTFPLTFSPDEKKKRQINFIRAYVTDNTGPAWSASVNVDEGNVVVNDFVEIPDPVYRVYAPNAVPLDGANVKELIWLPNGAVTQYAMPYGGTTVAGPLMGYRFVIMPVFPNNQLPNDLLAFDVCYGDVEDTDMAAM